MPIKHNNALIIVSEIKKGEFTASNNVAGDITKTYAPTAELAIEAMKEHLDGESDERNR
jgi:hypothetical protein